MTLFLVGVAVGLPAGALPVLTLWSRWADEHHYRRVRLEATRVDLLWHDCDHYARESRRLTDEHAELREGLGEVLDTVAYQWQVIDQLTEPAPAYADFAYGVNR